MDELGTGGELIIEMIEAERYEESFGLSTIATKTEMTASFIRLSARHSGQDSVLIALNKARNALLAETPEAKEFRLSVLSHLDNVMRLEAELAEYERVLTDDPEDSSSWYSKGLALGELGRHKEALEAFDRTLAINPDDNTAWFQRGRSLNELGRHEEELAAYDQALAIDAEDNIAWFNKGVTLGQLERHNEALDTLDRSLAIEPYHRDAWFQKAVTLDHLGRHEEELAACDRALAINPKDSEIWHIKGATLSQLGQHQEALHAYDRALFLDAGFGKAWRSKGQALSQLGRLQEALEAYNRALAIDPNNPDAWYDNGITLKNLKRHQEALEAFTRALAIDSHSSAAWQNKGLVLGQLGRHQEALEAFDSSLALNSEDAAAWHNKGCALNRLGRQTEALQVYDHLLSIDSENVNAWHNKARTLNQLGRLEEALGAASHALTIDPDNSASWFQKGQALEKMGVPDAALEAYDRALISDPSSVLAANARKLLFERIASFKSAQPTSQAAPQPPPPPPPAQQAAPQGSSGPYCNRCGTSLNARGFCATCNKFTAPAATAQQMGRWLGYNWSLLRRWSKAHPILALVIPGFFLWVLILVSSNDNSRQAPAQAVAAASVSKPVAVATGTYTGVSEEPAPTAPTVSVSGTYVGTVHNQTANLSSSAAVVLHQTKAGLIEGCMDVKPPLYGRGALRGSIRGTHLNFVVADITFQGEVSKDEIAGSYTVSRKDGNQLGNFHLTKQKPPEASYLCASGVLIEAAIESSPPSSSQQYGEGPHGHKALPSATKSHSPLHATVVGSSQPPPHTTQAAAPTAGAAVIEPPRGDSARTAGNLEVLSDTQGVDFGPYLSGVLQAVRMNWYKLIPEAVRPPLLERGKVSIEFAILPDGKVAGMRITSPSGDVSLDRAAWGGITASNPFAPLPSEFHGPYLALRFHFWYNPAKGDIQ